MGTMSDYWQLKVKLEEKIHLHKFITQRCPNKLKKTFLIEDFFHLPPVTATQVGASWAANISANYWKKLKTALMGYSGARGKLIHEKTPKSKISWHCPFKSMESILWPCLLEQRPQRRGQQRTRTGDAGALTATSKLFFFFRFIKSLIKNRLLCNVFIS